MSLIVGIFLITSLVAYAGIIYNSKIYWGNNPQIELSEWIKGNIDKNSKILIDEDDCGIFNKTSYKVLCTKGKSTALTGLWILNPISIKSINEETDYIVTTKELNLKIIKKTENNIYLYKAN